MLWLASQHRCTLKGQVSARETLAVALAALQMFYDVSSLCCVVQISVSAAMRASNVSFRL